MSATSTTVTVNVHAVCTVKLVGSMMCSGMEVFQMGRHIPTEVRP